jgi:twitching motility protein PilT
MDVQQIFKEAVKQQASDIFVIAGLPLSYKVNGHIVSQQEKPLAPGDTERIIRGIYELLGGHAPDLLENAGDDDFSFSLPGVSRFRVSAYKQRGSLAAVIRVVNFELPDPGRLGIPDIVLQIAGRTKGLVLVTGPAGSGKSTTQACMIDAINKIRSGHIITLEDPIEYLHRHNKSIVSQREIPADSRSYVQALRASLRQSPSVILLGEMRDYETINIAMTAAETGHLIISTLHTIGAANTIDRIIDVFPSNQQQQIRIQLSMVLQAVISQQLIPTLDGRVAPAFEIMQTTPAIRNMIRESKVHQIDSVIFGSQYGRMISMDASILYLYRKGVISKGDAVAYSVNPELMAKKLELEL